MMKLFNEDVKNSQVYKDFSESLKNDLKSGTDLFPDLVLEDKNISPLYGRRFTLINFWFSFCPPCIEEIPQYKSIHEKYKNRGFEIIGVSTDRTKDISHWKKVLMENQIKWLNLLDENALIARQLNISKFPTVFLLDHQGRILQKDISPADLEVFLKEHLTEK